MWTSPAFPYQESDLDCFRDLQQLAYRCAERVAAWLRPEVTERQAADRLRQELLAAGVFASRPVARFGERTARPYALVGNCRLRDGMPYILACAPIAGGYRAAVGLSGRCGTNRVWDALAADLGAYRDLVLREARRGSPLHRLHWEMDALADRHGYRALPGGVIGCSAAFRSFGGVFRRPASGPLPPGLWAVTPRLAFQGVGVTFAELLVVTEESACWLDDDLPHVR